LTARALLLKENGRTLGNLECQTGKERQEYKEKRTRRRRQLKITRSRLERDSEAHGNPKIELRRGHRSVVHQILSYALLTLYAPLTIMTLCSRDVASHPLCAPRHTPRASHHTQSTFCSFREKLLMVLSLQNCIQNE